MKVGGKYHVDDEAMEKAYDRTLMWRLMTYIRPHAVMSAVAMVLVLLGVCARLATPWLMGLAADVVRLEDSAANDGSSRAGMPQVFSKRVNEVVRGIDAEAQSREDRIDGRRRLLLIFGFAYLGAVIFRWIVQYVEAFLLQVVGQRIIYSMRLQVFTHLQKLSLSFYDKHPVGRLVTRVTNDINAINEMFSEALITVVGDVFLILGVGVAMFWIHWRLALLAFAVIPILFGAAAVFRYFFRRAYRAVRGKLAGINAFLSESLLGMKTIQMFHQEKRKLREFDEINKQYLKEVFMAIRFSSLTRPVATVISSIGIALIMWYGGRSVLAHDPTITLGTLIAFIWLSQMTYHPVINITQRYQLVQAAMASSERVFRLLDTEEVIEDRPCALKPQDMAGHIEFRNVWFRYDEEGDWILRNVSFSVDPGESVAIVGETGAGKSSIISLLLRFYDVQKGQVLVDGVDVRDIDKVELRRHVGLVLQDVFIFSGDVAYNIRLGNDVSLDDVRRCGKYVNADRFIERMEGGYDADVQERGSALSVGERQLLAFARALAFEPSVLILDEATSNVDMETELLIRDALKKLIKGRTSIIVAHRLSTIRNVDRVVVIHKGEVKETGTHGQLLRQRGLFYRFYQLQSAEELSSEG
jgi:ABC-type multidrug transport system fused ATPase/permease subunit